MANLLSAGLPELKTDYGPDWGKIAAVSHYMTQANLLKKKQQEDEATRQTMGGYVPGAGVNQEMMGNLLKVNPEMAMKVIGAESAMDKRGTEATARQLETANKALDFALKQAPLLYDNPQAWPAFQQTMTKVYGLDPNIFPPDLHTRPLDQYNAAISHLEQGSMTLKDRLSAREPKFHTYQEGDTKKTVTTSQATGSQITPIAEAPAYDPPKASTAPMHVQDPNSPTGWSYSDLLGNITPGAPAPASDVNKMDPFKASQRISQIQQQRTQLAGSLERLKKGDVISQALAQFMGRPEIAGTQATDDMVQQLNDSSKSANEAWDREVTLLKPYSDAKPTEQPGSRSVSQGMPVARGINAPGAASTNGRPQYIRNRTTGEVRKLNPSTGQYEPIR